MNYLFVFDPETNEVHLEDERGPHPAHFPVHHEMATHVNHPDRVDGYVQEIDGGWRIKDDEGKKLHDPYVQKRVLLALRKKHPLRLPSVK